MSENTNSTTTGGVSFGGLLLLVFVCAKIFGVEPVAGWSWWWVMAPLWMPLALVAVILGGMVLVAMIWKHS